MRRFILHTLLFVAPVVGVVAGLNYWGDAANVFSSQYEAGVSRQMLAGHHVTNVFNYDERILQRCLIQGMDFCPEVLVLGSSRLMLIGGAQFPGKRFWNNAVSGATVEDYYAILELYRQKGCTPGHIILGTDPWMLNANHGYVRHHALHLETQRHAAWLAGDTAPTDALIDRARQFIYTNEPKLQLFSPSYLQFSVYGLLYRDKAIRVVQDSLHATQTKLRDGALVYEAEFREVDSAGAATRALGYASGRLVGLEDYNAIDAGLLRRFEVMIARLREEGKAVTLMLTPYHPIVWDGLHKAGRAAIVMQAEQAFRDMGKRLGCTVRGGYAPAPLGFDGADFYDGQHLRPAQVVKMMEP